jgi:hypothetical protein
MNISLILVRKYPDALWSLEGDTYSGLNWRSDTPKPTEETLESLWPEVEYEAAYEEVEKARRVGYQTSSDPIFFEFQRGDKTEAEWLAAVQAVKDANPYPGAL